MPIEAAVQGTPAQPRVAVLGAGSWGTALAALTARHGCPTTLWGRDAECVAAIDSEHRNPRYLPDLELPESLRATTDLPGALRDAELVLVVVPSHAFAETLRALAPHRPAAAGVAWATKGFEPGSGRFLHEVAGEVLGDGVPLAVVTGPSFAKEVAAGLPTALTVHSDTPAFAQSEPAGDRVDVNGMRMYYEVSGEGDPLVVLHGAYMHIPSMGAILPKLAESHKVYALEFQGIDLVALGQLREDRAHRGDVHVGAVKDDKRVALSRDLVVHPHSVDVDTIAGGFGLGECGCIGMDCQCRRQAGGDFLGEGRTGHDRQRHAVAQHLAGDLVQEPATARLEPLGCPRHTGRGRPVGGQRAQGFGKGVGRHDHQHQLRIAQRARQIRGGAQRFRQLQIGQVTRIAVLAVDGRNALRITTPQRGGAAVARSQCRKRGAP